MKKTIVSAAFGALALAAGAFALPGGAWAETAPSAVKAGVYKVEPYHTQISFTLSHFGLSNYTGVFSGASGSLKLDPAKLEDTKLDVSVATDTVLTTVPKLTGELKDDKWLDAAKFPQARFVSTKVTAVGADEATIAGELTLHGVTKPVVLKAKFVGAGVNPIDKAYTVGFVASGVIKRTEFGVSTYAPMIGDDVTLIVNGAFELQN